MINSRQMRGTGHVARVGVEIGACKVLVGYLSERDRLENLGVDGKIV